jgi:6-phosphogluconolactonase/glucosamine-6-phosphate isomerase/deaminase
VIDFSSFLTKQSVFFNKLYGITFVTVESAEKGNDLAKDIIYEVVDKKTALFLSGGKTPQILYKDLAKEYRLNAGAVALIDERFGEKFHENSNETMVKQSGLVSYLFSHGIRVYPILTDKPIPIEQSAEKYDEQVRSLFAQFPQSVGILGVGLDGHTAGLPANSNIWKQPQMQDKNSFVTYFNDNGGFYKQRITMTFLGLSMLDFYVVLVFGENKKKALELLLKDGPEEEVPARFFKRPDIAKKTLFITDQKV